MHVMVDYLHFRISEFSRSTLNIILPKESSLFILHFDFYGKF